MKVTTAIKKILRWIANPDIGNQLGKAELKRIKDGLKLHAILYLNCKVK